VASGQSKANYGTEADVLTAMQWERSCGEKFAAPVLIVGIVIARFSGLVLLPTTHCPLLFLASRFKPSAMSHRHAEILVRIDWGVVDANFVVKMRAGGASARSHVADGVAAMNLLP